MTRELTNGKALPILGLPLLGGGEQPNDWGIRGSEWSIVAGVLRLRVRVAKDGTAPKEMCRTRPVEDAR